MSRLDAARPDRWMTDAYRALTTRAAPGDWAALAALGEAAAQVTSRAFLEHDARAWEVAQAVQWRIHQRAKLRPFEPSDAVVLATLYRIEESTLAWSTGPDGLSPSAFCELLAREVGAHSSADGSMIAMIQSGALGPDEWRFLGYQWWLPSAVDFTRQNALASLSLPRAQARVLYENLYDEAGRGDATRAHFEMLRRFLDRFGVRSDDERRRVAGGDRRDHLLARGPGDRPQRRAPARPGAEAGVGRRVPFLHRLAGDWRRPARAHRGSGE